MRTFGRLLPYGGAGAPLPCTDLTFCKNGGTCSRFKVAKEMRQECDCQTGYTGKTCESPDLSKQCTAGGCKRAAGPAECSLGWVGKPWGFITAEPAPAKQAYRSSHSLLRGAAQGGTVFAVCFTAHPGMMRHVSGSAGTAGNAWTS